MGLFDEEAGIFRPIYRNRGRVVYSRSGSWQAELTSLTQEGVAKRLIFSVVIPYRDCKGSMPQGRESLNPHDTCG